MNIALRIFAGVIDLLQFVFFITLLAFQLMTPVGGGVAGAVSGAAVCYSLSSGASSITNAAACLLGGGLVGSALSAFAIPIGIIIDIAISGTFGILLILMLWVTGRFDFMTIMMGFVTEMLPGINGFAPGWSIMVHNCIKQYKLKEKGVGKGTRTALTLVGGASKLLPSIGVASAALSPALSIANRSITKGVELQATRGRVPLQTRNFDGIRAANDNTPQRHTYAKAA